MSKDSTTNEPEPVHEPSPSPKLRRRRVQQLNSELGRLAGSAVGCLMIGWACYNLVANFRFLRIAETDPQSMSLAIGVVALFCVVPFVFGIWLVAKTLK